MKEYYVAIRFFYIWKLEYWWIAFENPHFHPDNRKHLKGNWFWRK